MLYQLNILILESGAREKEYTACAYHTGCVNEPLIKIGFLHYEKLVRDKR